MNPHGFPSRQTVGKLLELVSGKAAALNCRDKAGKRISEVNATAFSAVKPDDIREMLLQAGFSPNGKDALISGTTGEYMNCYVYTGPIFYQRLKHMVRDKMHARGIGRVNRITRQPPPGKSRDGGLRVGEMEKDVLVSYGATNLILERMMLSSDKFTCWFCQECGMIK